MVSENLECNKYFSQATLVLLSVCYMVYVVQNWLGLELRKIH